MELYIGKSTNPPGGNIGELPTPNVLILRYRNGLRPNETTAPYFAINTKASLGGAIYIIKIWPRRKAGVKNMAELAAAPLLHPTTPPNRQ